MWTNWIKKNKETKKKRNSNNRKTKKKETKEKPKQINNKKKPSRTSCWREVHLSTSVFLVLVVLGAAMKGRVAPLAHDVLRDQAVDTL
jgi:hypothetical protein